ncbi:MAG: hypothetical protein QNJ42_13095 [Crocosphaera sp.]|nr:hypothetical protein [Crocosphaera sp.]
MSQTPINVTYSLEDVLKEINQKLEKLNDKIDDLQKDMTDVKVGIARLDEKVDGLNKRLEYQEFINRGVLILKFNSCNNLPTF